MKKAEENKRKIPFIIEVRDYISFSTIIKKENNKLNETPLISDDKTEKVIEPKSFNLFSHILEG